MRDDQISKKAQALSAEMLDIYQSMVPVLQDFGRKYSTAQWVDDIERIHFLLDGIDDEQPEGELVVREGDFSLYRTEDGHETVVFHIIPYLSEEKQIQYGYTPRRIMALFESGDTEGAIAELYEATKSLTTKTQLVVEGKSNDGSGKFDITRFGWPVAVDEKLLYYVDKETSQYNAIPLVMVKDVPDIPVAKLATGRNKEYDRIDAMIDQCQAVFTADQINALKRFLFRHNDKLTHGAKGNVYIIRPHFNFGSTSFKPHAPKPGAIRGLVWTPEEVDRSGYGPKVAEDDYFEAYGGDDTHIVPKFMVMRDLPPMSPHDVRGPRDVPSLRSFLLEQWGPDKPFRRMAVEQAVVSPDFGQYPSTGKEDFLKGFIVTETVMLQKANMWWVSEEMVDVLTATAPAVPNDVTVNDLLLPGPAGLVVFEKPVYGQDSLNNEVMVNAIVWGLNKMGPVPSQPEGSTVLSISSYRRIDFDEGLDHADAVMAVKTGLIEHGQRGAERVEGDNLSFNLHGVTWAYTGRSDWPVADELNQAPFPDLPEGQMLSFIEDRRLIAAFLTLIAQEAIAETEYHPIPRPEKRRAERSGVRREANDLRVVTLRRKHRNVVEDDDTEPVEGTGRVYSHRWMVNPFYRWQRVGKGRQERRLTLVRGHVKGPDDKPLKIKQEVKAWVR